MLKAPCVTEISMWAREDAAKMIRKRANILLITAAYATGAALVKRVIG
ncbi:hypothetical protein BAV1279 [Bordetella avium 197N]|uniref:Uncharacterized protein n=1 Tax=Bordetella avium (strain 197N) TaxID=360910 RepID=Q2L303_BORA1|nr:hypothetical protein BAV1279 [Bordetella avium 197N]